MTDLTKPDKMISRRSLAKLALAGAVIAPTAWVVALKLKDNPLREVAEPHLKLDGGWVLDIGDTHNGDNTGNTG